jgi:hypothetical protein
MAASMTGWLFEVPGITGSLNPDPRAGALDLAEIVRREFDVDGCDVLVQAVQPPCSGAPRPRGR